MRLVIPGLAALALLAAACGEGKVQDSCYGACADWTTCVAGDCIPDEGRCRSGDDCDDGFGCDVEAHVCEPLTVVCEPACEEWEVCKAGRCELDFGRCEQHADCVDVCDFTSHTCVEPECDPPCAEWELCQAAACVTHPDRCVDDTDCGIDTPVCSQLTHTCELPASEATLVNRSSPAALIVTTAELRAPFVELATLHTLGGVVTAVVTVEEICGRRPCDDADPKADTAKAIKGELAARTGLAYVVLGGDLEHVPARMVHDAFQNPFAGADFEQDFVTDYYYADLSQWDGDGDGIYAEDGQDTPDYRPELAVGRIPASTVAEADAYVEKVRAYLTATDVATLRQTLLLSNVAAERDVFGERVEIDGATYLEMDGRTLSLFPAEYAFTKLYATGYGNEETLTVERERQELEKGPHFVVHSGHGGVGDLTVELNGGKAFTGDMAAALGNVSYPLFFSCACDAGTFSAADSAGERLVLNPAGGAIGYLGNGATGLGLAGSSQIIDEFLRRVFHGGVVNPLAAEALKAAHLEMPTSDTIRVVVNVPVVDRASYEWTQKASVYLGDPLVPVWSNVDLAPSPFVSVQRRVAGSASQLRFDFFGAGSGTLYFDTGANLYRVPVVDGMPVVVEIPEVPARLRAGLVGPDALHAYLDETF